MTEWLESRGLDPELAARMGWAEYRDKAGAAWVRIPYVRDGQTINHKYRKIGAKEFRNDLGAEHDLWNVDCLKDETLNNEPLIITEGECDALAVMQAGFPRVVSVPDGWTEGLEDEAGQPKFEVLKRNKDRLTGRVVIAADDDGPGKSMLRAIANLLDGDAWYVDWPKGCKDANDALRQGSLEQALKTPKRIDPPGGLITGFSDLPPRPDVQVWKLGYRKIDQRMAFRTREISVLTGIPGAGKTTFATWVAHHLVRVADIRVGIGLFETDPQEVLNHLAKLRCSVPRDELPGVLDRNFRLFHRVEDGDHTHGMGWLQKVIHTLAARDGCKVIIIDPWNELEHLPQPGESLTQYTNFALMRLRQWAEKYDIHIMVIAHPRKMNDARTPTGYDISDSAAWANKPGMGWTIHIADEGDSVELMTWKVRSRQTTGCAPGTTKLTFDQEAMVYREA